MSVFSVNYWMSKGLTEEEAKYQISIRRPNNILYYINKGFTKEEAEIQVKQRQAKGGVKRSLMSNDDKRKLSPRCIEFWVNKGLSKEQAKKELSKFQTTFSKEICIEKYGFEKGIKIWNNRQKTWQSSLNNKSNEVLADINSRKNRWIKLSNNETLLLKEKISNAVKKTTAKRSLDEKLAVGQNIRNGMVMSGRAIPEHQMNEFKLYKSIVWRITNKNNLYLLENFDKRGKNNYHLDHKFSIWQGFVDNIDPYVIGNIQNLEMIPFKKNLSKFNKCSITLDQLKKVIEETNV